MKLLNNTNRFVSKASRSFSIYVATTGSDTTGTGASSAPYRQIQRAIQDLPEYIDTAIVINVGAGDFDGDVRIPTLQFTDGGLLIIQGNKSSSATLTATGGAANTDGYGTLTVADAGWEVDEHIGKFVEILTMTGSDSVRFSRFLPIHSNTSDTLTLPILDFAPSGDTTFKIVVNNTNINCAGSDGFSFANCKVDKNYWIDGDFYYYLKMNLLNFNIKEFYYGINNDSSVVMYSGCTFSNTEETGSYCSFTSGEGYTVGQGLYTSGKVSYLDNCYEVASSYVKDVYADFTVADGTHIYATVGYDGSKPSMSNAILEADSGKNINSVAIADGKSVVYIGNMRVDYCNNLRRSTGGEVILYPADSIYGTNIAKDANIQMGGKILYVSNSNISPATEYDLEPSGKIYRYIADDDKYVAYKNTITGKTYTAVTDTISSSFEKTAATCTSALVLTSTPTITAGLFIGQEVEIYGTSDTNTLTLQDDGTLAGSNVLLKSGTSVTLANGDMVKFFWNGTSWVEKYRSLYAGV